MTVIRKSMPRLREAIGIGITLCVTGLCVEVIRAQPSKGIAFRIDPNWPKLPPGRPSDPACGAVSVTCTATLL
jgi:hypothetical protein